MRFIGLDDLVPRQLYKKIWFAFFVMIILLSYVQVFMAEHYIRRRADEGIQRRFWSLAESIVGELTPLIKSEDSAPFLDRLHAIQQLHPMSKILFLDEDGNVQSPTSDKTSNSLNWENGIHSFQLDAIHEFLHPIVNRKLPLYCPSPFSKKEEIVFSAAHTQFASGPKYLVVTLSDGHAHLLYDTLRLRTLIYGGAAWQFVVLVFASGLGAILFYFVTRRFNRLVKTVDTIAEGDLDARIPVTGNDEIAQLGSQINKMADTISANMALIKENDQRRRELIANISHDLRSPVTCLEGYAESTLTGFSSMSHDDIRENIEIVLRNARTLRILVEQLFELSKLEARDVEPSFEAFSLLDIITEDLVPKYQPLAKEFKTTITTELPAHLELVQGDLHLLYRALSNLVENAIRYNKVGGKVCISVSETENRAEIYVRDTGPGIKKEDLPRIFDRFYTGNKARTKGSSSTGLGLAIVKKILELHNETITVESEEGEGTSFHFGLTTVEPED